MQSEELAALLAEASKEILGLKDDNIDVVFGGVQWSPLEFTQHAGDEMYHTMYGQASGSMSTNDFSVEKTERRYF